MAGTIDKRVADTFEKKINFKIICNQKESEEFNEYVIFCFDIELIPFK